MLDARGLGIEYSAEELSKCKKVADLFTNDNRLIYAELLCDELGRKIYLREWLTGSDPDNSFNFCIINSIEELKSELKKDADHGDLPHGRINKICEDIKSTGVFDL